MRRPQRLAGAHAWRWPTAPIEGRCAVDFRHEGPLRVLQTLYPEGPAIAHNVLVHPPSGIVGGDLLDIDIRVGPAAHGLVTTPGATRFYRSAGEPAVQRSAISLAAGARFEWLPLEAICYSGCIAENRLTLDLADGAEMIGWDVTALGLPAAQLAFQRGSLLQHLELRGRWLERGRIAAEDALLLDGPLGLAGHRCFGTLFFAAGSALPRGRREQALQVGQRGDRRAPGPCAGRRHGRGAGGDRGARAGAAGRARARAAPGDSRRLASGPVGPAGHAAAHLGAVSGAQIATRVVSAARRHPRSGCPRWGIPRCRWCCA